MMFRLAGAMLLAASFAPAQTLEGGALVKALRQGGYVIVMRHTSSPREIPDKQTANPDNTKPERQLDAEGRATAAAMGQALRDLKIPIGEVLSSPTYRALETVKFARFGPAKPQVELGDNGQDMQGGTEAQAVWLRKRVTQFQPGTNVLLVTHAPNLTRAFPQQANGVADGEALIFGPDGKGGAALVARVKVEDWPKLKGSD
ncbi:MAG TPA: histidine phosphatase family protein [Bryobacteraceae bacterium]